jgi:hypothetical protein
MMPNSLWGDLSALPTPRTPKSILREQADVLNHYTHAVIFAEVTDDSDAVALKVTLDLVAPALNNYRYTIVTVRHKIELYPCEVLPFGSYGGSKKCDDEQMFLEVLSGLLGSSKVREVIAALLAQSQS